MVSDTLLTQNEAASFLRLSPRTLERHRVTGNGPKFMKAGKRVLYSDEELRNWLAANTFQSTSEINAPTGAF
jgi:hypothetical protein